MKELKTHDSTELETPIRRSRWPWFIAGGSLLVILLALFSPRVRERPSTGATPGDAPGSGTAAGSSSAGRDRQFGRRSGLVAAPAPTAGEIVASKIKQFGQSRREIVRAIARRAHKDVPPEVEKFFDAVESGRWEEIDARWSAMAKRSGQYEGSRHAAELDEFWPAVLEAYGAAEQAHDWPAQQLLDYGESILGSLRPGMVYVGGTDPGRFIPTLLNETSDGERHIVLTQNALADGRYLDYVSFLYSDRFGTVTTEDSRRAFEEYITDAQNRLQHDQQFPDEPKQIRPGEDVRVVDGKVQVSGQIAVMSINEKLLMACMEKNPGVSFAVEESYPFKGTYADAAPLGPIMELRAQGGPNAFTAELAGQSIDYWRAATQQLLSDPEAAGSRETLKTYSHTAASQANLLASHNFNEEAEEAYRLASQLSPSNPEAVGGLSEMLVRAGRGNEARELLDDFARRNPDQRSNLERFQGSILMTAKPGRP